MDGKSRIQRYLSYSSRMVAGYAPLRKFFETCFQLERFDARVALAAWRPRRPETLQTWERFPKALTYMDMHKSREIFSRPEARRSPRLSCDARYGPCDLLFLDMDQVPDTSGERHPLLSLISACFWVIRECFARADLVCWSDLIEPDSFR